MVKVLILYYCGLGEVPKDFERYRAAIIDGEKRLVALKVPKNEFSQFIRCLEEDGIDNVCFRSEEGLTYIVKEGP